MRKLDLTGQQFGRLTVIKKEASDKSGRIRWLCQCVCGQKTIVAATRLLNGQSHSCGCLQKDRVKEINTTHGLTKLRKGEKRIPKIYQTWANIKTRCTNSKTSYYGRYGGRGITVCDEWREDFQAFYDWAMANGYEEGLQIDRIDNDGDYTPENCRWVSQETNANNKRNNRLIEYLGDTHTVAEWARITGISQKAIYTRIASGKPPDEILKK